MSLNYLKVYYAKYFSVIHHYVPRRILFGILQNLLDWCIINGNLDYSETDMMPVI